MDDKEKIAEIIRLLEELKFQEKIVLGYTDKEMIELFRGKVKEIKKWSVSVLALANLPR